jgi:hypothetical protein
MAAPLSPEEASRRLKAYDAAVQSGIPNPNAVAAHALGLSPHSFTEWRRRYKPQDPAIEAAKAAVRTAISPALVWAKTKPDADGNSFSVLLKPQAEDGPDFAERLVKAFEDLPPALPIAPPEYADADLMTVIPIADAHIGMMAWGEETGQDNDTKIATARLMSWVSRCVDASPPSDHAVILDVGDLVHSDNQDNKTRASGHVLDVDTRHFKTMFATVAALVYSIDYALRKHRRVTVKIIPGNHNPDSYVGIVLALVAHYRNEPRVTVQDKPGDFWVYRFGQCLIAAHHGHKAKADRMVMYLADEYAELWGATRHRFLFTGHLHHHKSADVGGVRWEQLRAVTTRDAYAVGAAYVARSELQAITYHRDRGEIQRVRVGM